MIETTKNLAVLGPAAAKAALVSGAAALEKCVNNEGIPQNAYEFDVRYRKRYTQWK